MKKPTFSDALASEASPESRSGETKAKSGDDMVNTTLRISSKGLRALKNVAADERVRVNEIVLEGIELALSLRGVKVQLRK